MCFIYMFNVPGQEPAYILVKRDIQKNVFFFTSLAFFSGKVDVHMGKEEVFSVKLNLDERKRFICIISFMKILSFSRTNYAGICTKYSL